MKRKKNFFKKNFTFEENPVLDEKLQSLEHSVSTVYHIAMECVLRVCDYELNPETRAVFIYRHILKMT